MTQTEFLSGVDEEPPSLDSYESYSNQLLTVHNRFAVFPSYTNYTDKSRAFEVRLFDDDESMHIEATMQGLLVDRYRKLDCERQFELADRMERAMGRTADLLMKNGHSLSIKNDAVVMINNLPVLFEPTNNAMLVGRWEDWDKKRMMLRSRHIENRAQQCLLLGGLASFVTYLEQQ